ncbi:hypothetical protein RHMOL_Rhmol08G0151200 [Rhododendron molle]|uniref:Uncharacterized protein n=1 Tax=Rhododendron molle TaxID=49168 RepID=A0ACC0MNM6_RHOML|nr:hypothetical protein RHMOL_Rhmol08G0151200 [Rhododendron molle]
MNGCFAPDWEIFARDKSMSCFLKLSFNYFVRWTQLKEDCMSFFPSARLVNGFEIQITRRDDELEMK